jgi:ABC-type bacteriocin/lantibiotic exporter with double-glycine peptidase domain
MPPPPLIEQENEDSCVLACLRMILAHSGQDIPESELANSARKQVGGVNIEDLATVAREYGLQSEILQLDIDSIARWIAQDVYPIVYLNRAYFAKSARISRVAALKSAIVHAVIPIRISRHFVVFHDPRQRDKHRVSKRMFDAAQRDLQYWCVVCR